MRALGPRILVYLRSIATELKRANDLTEIRLAFDHPEWTRTRKVPGGRPSKVLHSGVAKVEDWNEEWEKKQKERLGYD